MNVRRCVLGVALVVVCGLLVRYCGDRRLVPVDAKKVDRIGLWSIREQSRTRPTWLGMYYEGSASTEHIFTNRCLGAIEWFRVGGESLLVDGEFVVGAGQPVSIYHPDLRSKTLYLHGAPKRERPQANMASGWDVTRAPKLLDLSRSLPTTVETDKGRAERRGASRVAELDAFEEAVIMLEGVASYVPLAVSGSDEVEAREYCEAVSRVVSTHSADAAELSVREISLLARLNVVMTNFGCVGARDSAYYYFDKWSERVGMNAENGCYYGLLMANSDARIIDSIDGLRELYEDAPGRVWLILAYALQVTGHSEDSKAILREAFNYNRMGSDAVVIYRRWFGH